LARLTRHQLKQDELSGTLTSALDFFLKHKQRILIILAAAVGALAVIVGVYLYVQSAQNKAAAAFTKALDTYHAPVMTTPPSVPNLETYTTNDAKNKKALEAFTTVAQDYSHYSAGRLARFYAAVCQRELGKFPEAEKEFQALSRISDSRLASLAKVGLASVYEMTSRAAEAEKIYKEIEANPTETVPKSTALIARADLYSKTNPTEAVTLFQQIQKDYPGSAAAEHATQMLAQLPH
jgi:tetratricopeptide (TPR) repeat protein